MKNYIRMMLLSIVLVLTNGCKKEELPSNLEVANEHMPEENSWLFFNENVFTLEDTNNTITLSLDQNALWFENDSGGLAYQNIIGDFVLSAKVLVRRKSDDTQAPNCNVCLGGLMARNPNSTNAENYVHLVSGNIPETENDGADELGIEYKSTTDNISAFTAVPDGSSDHELKIQREGNNFLMSYRTIGASDWVLIQTYDRPNLPETLQVGFNIYTAKTGATADLKIIYEDIVIN